MSKDRMVRIVFCNKCHKVAAQVEISNEGTKIMQGGKTIISLGDKSSIAGMKGNALSIVCPQGHKVKVAV
ncbi:hypothetical protein LCGC14_1303450 [marine sediment metagenome]|uniref:Uncharacterized protein n=1 Tax=marine sediment metagenome TaxID=412755 RepID=A0A0F9N5K5_9ZZZZ